MLITDWLCACVAGTTIDGCEITEQQISQIAVTYNQTLSQPRVRHDKRYHEEKTVY